MYVVLLLLIRTAKCSISILQTEIIDRMRQYQLADTTGRDWD